MTIAVRCLIVVAILTSSFAGGCGGQPLGHFPGSGATTWTLNDGTVVRFYKPESDGKGGFRQGSIKVLEVTRPGEEAKRHEFGHGHAGYSWVELRANYDQSVIWIVDTQRRDRGFNRAQGRTAAIGCSYVVATGQFVGETDDEPRKRSQQKPTGEVVFTDEPKHPECVGGATGTVLTPQ